MSESLKYTPGNLKKVEAILEAAGYTLLYERGSFKPGSCVIEERKIVVVNKYFDTEGRINSLVDIVASLRIENASLPENLRALHERISLQNEAAA